MPETRKLEPRQIQEYFDTFSKRFLRGKGINLADVEVTSPDLGAQFEAEGVPLSGVTYDPERKELDIMLEAGDHRIFKPSEVWVVEETDGFVRSIEVVLADGAKEIIRVKRAALEPLNRDAEQQKPFQSRR